MAWLSGWQYRKKITIDKTKVDADLTDFPVLVKLTSSNFNFSKARSDGYDIRFTSSDGTTLLKYERERHDSANQVAEYHVKIPSVSSSSNTDFYIYYGNSSASDGADPTNVWDSYFKGVWHLKDYTTSQVNDSTTNANNGTKKAANEPLEVDAKIGKGQSFDGTDDYVNCGTGASLNPSYITIEAWAYLNTWTNRTFPAIVKKAPAAYALEGYNTDQVMRFWIYSGGGWRGPAEVSFPTGQWLHIVATYDGSAIRIYKNGVEGTPYSWSGTLAASSASVNFGRDPEIPAETGRYWVGFIDEVRISSVARSAAWIKASYNSGNNSLLSYGNEELLPAFLLFFN